MAEASNTDLIAKAKANLENVARSMPSGKLPTTDDRVALISQLVTALEAVTVSTENYQEKMARLWENTTPGKREAAARLAEAARAVGSDSEREALQRTLTNVLSNASNFPSKAIPYLLGQNMGPLNAKVAEAVLARGFRLPAVPTEGERESLIDFLLTAPIVEGFDWVGTGSQPSEEYIHDEVGELADAILARFRLPVPVDPQPHDPQTGRKQ